MTPDNARRVTEVDRSRRIAPGHSADSPPRSVAQRILIVEDEPRLREMLLANVIEMGLEPTGAPSAENALRILEQQLFAIAVVDLNLPGIGGMELCERVRRRWPLIQLIILTGFGDLDSAKRAIRMEAVDFLTKPCGMDNLEAALGRARLRWLERWLTVADYRVPPAEQTEPESPETNESVLPSIPLSLDDMERKLIFAALKRHNGSRESAATELGISVRKLYYRLRQYHQRGLMPQE